MTTHLATWSGILQADGYGGYNELYREGRTPAPVLEAGCFAHARRTFFELADVLTSLIHGDAVGRLSARA